MDCVLTEENMANVEDAIGEDDREAEPSGEGPELATRFFEPLHWGITIVEDMESILRFGHRVRLSAFAKQLLELLCVKMGALEDVERSAEVATRAAEWREKHAQLAVASENELIDLLQLQTFASTQTTTTPRCRKCIRVMSLSHLVWS